MAFAQSGTENEEWRTCECDLVEEEGKVYECDILHKACTVRLEHQKYAVLRPFCRFTGVMGC
jgi:hypothetical protein